MKNLLAGCLALITSSSSAFALTMTFDATISNVQGSAALLSDLGIVSGGTLTARFSFDTDLTNGAVSENGPNFVGSRLYSTYDSFSLLAPSGTINAPTADAFNHRIHTLDGVSDGNVDVPDNFSIASIGNSGAFNSISIEAYDFDETKWSRSNPLLPSTLNSFANHRFFLSKNINGTQTTIQSNSVSYSLVAPAPVPIPASFPMLLIGLASLGFVARRRQNR